MSQDTFTRSTSFGLGSDGTFTYVWVERDSAYSAAADSDYFVDGSRIVIPTTRDYDSYVVDAPSFAKQGTVSFDIYLPALASSGFYPDFTFVLQWPDEQAFGDSIALGFGVQTDFGFNRETDPHILYGTKYYNDLTLKDKNGADVQPASLSVTPNSWYTVKATYDIDLLAMAVKMWKTGDVEPLDYAVIYRTSTDWCEAEDFGDGYDGKPWIDFYDTGSVTSYIDNITTGAYEEISYGFSAKAMVTSDQLRQYTDPYDRTTTYGLGPAYPFIPNLTGATNAESSFVDPTTDTIAVDGTQVVVPATTGQPRSAYSLPGSRFLRSGYIQIDFKTPASWTGTYGQHVIAIGRGNHQFGMFFGAVSATQWRVGYATGGVSGANLSFTASANTWYTAKLVYNDDTGEMLILAKAQGAADTSALVSFSQLGSTWAGNGYPYELDDDRIVIKTPPSGAGTLYLDNLVWSGQAGFTADAVLADNPLTIGLHAFIVVQTSASITADAAFAGRLTANAVITVVRSGSLTSNAAIVGRFLTADAAIGDIRRNRHLRTNDHEGSMALSKLVLGAPIVGRYPILPTYPAGMSVADVLSDIYDRVVAQGVPRFTADATLKKTMGVPYIVGTNYKPGSGLYVPIFAVIGTASSSSFTADAVIV